MSSQVRERISFSALRAPRATRLPLGLSVGELIAASLAVVALVVAIVYYFTSLRPEQARLRTLQEELTRQQKELAQNAVPNSQGPTSAGTIKEALESLQTFKSGYLKPLASGRIALINEINALAKKHSVQLTSGIDMPVEKGASTADAEGGKRKKKTEDFLNVYPRMNMHFTVFGQYNTLRAFISDLERNRQFLVIRSLNIVTQEEKSGGRRGRGNISGLTLTVDAAAYFQP